MAGAEFVLVNPGGGKRRRRNSGKRNAKGQFVGKRRNSSAPKRRRATHRRTRRNSPAAMLAPAATELLVLPAMGNPPRRRRRRSYSGSLFGKRRRNPADGPMDMLQTALPFAGGVYAGLHLMGRLPGSLGRWGSTPIGTAALAYAVNQWGGRILGPAAEPVSMGLFVAALLRVVQGQSIMGDPMEGSEVDAITSVELDGVEGYFVPSGFEGVFSAPARHRLPPLRPPPGLLPGPHPPGGESAADLLNLAPPGVPPRFWASLDEHDRDRIMQALRGPNRQQVLDAINESAKARGLFGDINDIAADLRRELAA